MSSPVSPVSRAFAAIAAAGLFLTSGPVTAADFYWDFDGLATGNDVNGAGLGGAGDWNLLSDKWWDGTTIGAWSNALTDNAIFSYPFPSSPYAIPLTQAVTVDAGGVSANRLTFQRSGYTLSGGAITLGGTNAGLHVNLGESATISSQISGTSGLVKSGGGAVRLANSSNNYTGTTLISNGIVIISDPGALGASSTAIGITETNLTPSNTGTTGFPGGTLFLDGSNGGFTVSRNINVQGNGAIGRGAAILSIGDNTLSGVISSAGGALTPNTFRNTRLTSANGTLTLSGTLNAGGTAGTTVTTLGGINSTGAGNFAITGVLSGTGYLEKGGAGTLFLNPTSTAGFSGRIRISGTSTTTGTAGQSSLRISSNLDGANATSIFGTSVEANASAPIDMNGGVLEIRSENSLNFGKNVYGRANSTIYAGPAVGGDGINGTMTFGNFRLAANTTQTFNSRNGYGFTFGTWTQESSNNPNTIANSGGGTLTFTGDIWNNSEATTARTLTLTATGNIFIGGSINTSGAAVKTLTKGGAGLLTIQGVATTLDGPVNVTAGALAITDFRSINNNTSAIVLGNATTTGGNLIIGTDATATSAGLTTAKTITLNTTSANNSIYANQSGAHPVILNGAISKIAGTTSASLVLGGTSTVDNTLNSAIPSTGTGGLVKLGAGTWVLGGANEYTGATTIQNGTLKIKATSGSSDIIKSASTNTIVFSADATTQTAGGTLQLTGFLDTATTEELGALTPTAGAARIVLQGTGTGSANLTFTSLGATTAASSVNFVTTAANGGVITLTGQAATTATTLPGTANFRGRLYINGADFAIINGSAQVVAPTYGGAGDFQNAASALVSAVHNKLTGSFTNGALTVSSLVTNSQTLTLSGNLVVSTGGILQSGGTATIQSDSATPRLINQTGTAATNLAIRVNGDTDVLNLGTLTNPVNIGSFTTGGLTKNGAGTLNIFGTNAQTGTTNINEGTVSLSGAASRLSATSAALVIRQGATLELNGTTSANATVGALDGAGTIKNVDSVALTFTQTGAGTWNGVFADGAGVLNVTKAGTTGAPTWSGLNTYTGVTTIGGTTGSVTVDVLANGDLPSGIGASSSAASNLIFSGTTAGIIYRGSVFNGALTLGSASATTDRLFTLAGTGATLTSNAINNNAIVWSNTGAIVHGIVGPQNFILAGSSTGDNTFNPRLTDSGTGANITRLTKTGAGQWNLGNTNNSYTGITEVQNGILALNPDATIGPDSPLVLNPTSATSAAIFQASGNFTRDLAATATPGSGTITWGFSIASTTGGVGFAAHTDPLTVAIGGLVSPTSLTWGSGGFIGTGGVQNFVLGSTTALSYVDFRNNVNLNGGVPLTGVDVTTNSTTTVTTADTSGLVIGQSITGSGIPAGAFITAISNGTTFTISAAATASATVPANILPAVRTVNVLDNGNTGADYAVMSGVLSGSGAGLRKIGAGSLRLTGANTYTGLTQVEAGAIVVSSLGRSTGSGGTSVGISGVTMDNTNAITLGNAGTGAATLQYVGPGEVSDRKIRLNTTTGTIQIHADGTGPLILTNLVNDMVAGAKTLALRGSNMQGNMITSVLEDFSSTALGVTVDGGAAWILSGNNTYSGTTTASAGALGVGHNNAFGTGNVNNNNGVMFSYGADRTISNNFVTTATTTAVAAAFIGDYGLVLDGSTWTFSNTTAGHTLTNNIVSEKALVVNSDLLFNSITANVTLTAEGNGTTILNGDFLSSTAFGIGILKNGNGVLELGGVLKNSATGTAPNIDVDRGTLRMGADNVILSGAGAGNLIISPEAAASDTATFDLNGTTQTVNALTANSNGVLKLDNSSSSAATFRFGANNTDIAFGGTSNGAVATAGSYTITNTGAGALSIVKLGNTATTFGSHVVLTHKGITATEGGTLTINANLAGSTGLSASGGSTLQLNGAWTTAAGNLSLSATGASTLIVSGGITSPNLFNSVTVGAGSTLSLLDGVGSQFANLTTLNLGNTGSGTVTLNLNVGDSTTSGDNVQTDRFTLATGGTLNLGNSITFNLTDAGLSPNESYVLLDATAIGGGLTSGPLSLVNYILGTTPGGFTSLSLSTSTDNQIILNTGNLITGSLYWRGLTNTTWNGNVNNWSTDKAGTTPATTTPGSGTDVIFAYDGVGTGALATTLEQNFKVNSLTFESGTTTPSSVTINPGALATARLEVAPQVSTDGIKISASGPASVTIASNLRLGANQTWNVVDSGSTLTLSGALFGERNVTKSGSGRVVLSGIADPTFNPGKTATFTVSAGNLEMTNTAALGTTLNDNVASIVVSGGGYYYNNATAGTAATLPHNITLSGGALSGGGGNHTYGGAVNVTAASTINMADSNGPSTNTVRSITLAGALTGSGALTIDSNDTASSGNQLGGTFTVNNAAGTWNGNLFFNRGTMTIAAAASATVLPANITFNNFGRYLVQGVDGQTINRAGTLVFAAGAVGEFQVDNTTTTQTTDFTVNQNGAITLGSGGTGATLRVALVDTFAKLNLAGPVTLGGNSSISVSNNANRVLTLSNVISDGGNGYTIAINDDAGGWAQTNGTVRFTGLNTFSGNISVAAGALEFNTVTDASGAASALGQGTAISLDGGNLRFIGSSPQSTNRPIAVNVASTLSANGATASDTITYTGAITVVPTADGSQLTLSGIAGRVGNITGGFTQTGTTADVTVNGGTWNLSGTQSSVADDFVVSGVGTILNLNSTGIVKLLSGGSGADLTIRAGATVNINALNAVQYTDSNFRIFVGQGADGADATLNLNQNLEAGRFILGERAATRVGIVNGPGTLTISDTGATAIELYRGEVNANLANSAATAGFAKQGAGTVTLRGDNSGLTYTSATAVNNGVLILDYTQSNTDKIRAASQLDMRGAELQIIGNAAANTLQAVNGLTLATGAGNSIISITAGASRTATLALGSTLTRAASVGTLRVNLVNAGAAITTSQANAAHGLLGTSAFFTLKDSSGTWFAANDGADNVIGLVSTAKNDVSTWLPTDHVTDTAGGFSGTILNGSIGSLRFNHSTASPVNIGTLGALGIASGGILVTNQVTAGTPGIHGGFLSSSSGELIVTHDSSRVFEISSSMVGTTAFTTTGSGTVLLSGNNSATGTTSIQNGRLQISGGNAIGDTAIVNLATNRHSVFELLASESIGRLAGGQRNTNSDYGLVEIGSHTLTLNQTGNTVYAGLITGTGSLVMSSATTANLQLTNLNTGFTGTIAVNGGLLQLVTSASINASAISVTGTGYLLIDNNGTTSSTTRILDTTPITLHSAAGTSSNIVRGLWVRNTDNNSSRFETIGNLVFGSGASYLLGEGNVGTGSGRAGIIANDFVRQNNATASVRGRNLGTTLTHHNQFRIGTTANETAFINAMIGGVGASGSATLKIVPWAIAETSNNAAMASDNMGNSLATYVAGTGFRPLDFGTEYASYSTAGGTNNTRESRTTDLTGITGRTVNSLVIHNANAAESTVNVTATGAGQALVNTSGAFLFTLNPAATASSIHNTTLGGFDDGISVGSSNEYVFHVVNPTGAATSPVLVASINSPLISDADLTKSGRGTLILSGTNTAGGGSRKTTLNEGVLQIASLANIGGSTGGLVFAGGTLRLGTGFADDFSTRTISFLSGGGILDTNGNDVTLANSLGSGSGNFTKTGAGNLTLNGTATYTGNSTLALGTITVGATNALGSGNLTLNAGTTLALGSNSISHALVTTAGASPQITGAGTISTSQGFNFNHTGNTQIDAILAGSGGLIKTQSNVLTLAGANTFTGSLDLRNGTIIFSSIGNVGGGATSLGSPTTAIDGVIRLGFTTTAGVLTYTGDGHSTDRLIGLQGTTGGGTLNANGTAAIVYGGAYGITQGVKTLTLSGTADPATLNRIGLIRDGSATLTVSKTGTGTWVLDVANTHSGGTSVTAGSLGLANNGSLGTGALTTGTATLFGVGGDRTLSNAVQHNNNTTTTYTGDFGVAFTGNLALLAAANNVATVNNIASGKTLTFNTVTADLMTGNRTWTISGSGATVIGGAVTTTTTFNVPLTFTGTGTLNLKGANTGLGATTVGSTAIAAGTLTVEAGSNLASAAVSVLSGVLNLQNGSQTITTLGMGNGPLGSTSRIDLDGGALTLGGTVTYTTSVNSGTATIEDGTINLGATRTFTINDSTQTDVEMLVDAVIANGAAASGITKGGIGTLVFNRANTYTGATSVNAGILRLAVAQSLTGALQFGSAAATTTAGTLEANEDASFGSMVVQTNSTTATSVLQIASGKTVTINGNVTIGTNTATSTTLFNATGGGAFVQTSTGGTFQVGGATSSNANAATADFSGLASMTVNLGATGTFRVGDANTATNVNPSTLILAPDTTVTANTVRIGDGSGAGSVHTLVLGNGTNLFNANTFNVGSAGNTIRSSGAMNFGISDTTGTLTIRAADGTGRAVLNMINTTGTTATDMTSTIDLTGHTSDLLVSTLTMANRTVGANAATSTFSFDQGTLDITTLTMASRTTASSSGNSTATVNLGDSAAVGSPTTTIGTLNMAVNTSAGGAVVADLNVTGGTVNIGTGSGTAINMANADTGRTVTSTIDLTGGTVNVTGNIVRTGGAGTENATITLDGAILDLNDNSIGSSTAAINLVAQSGTLRNLNELNGGGNLTKTGAGTLVLEGDNDYTGRTVITAGTVSISSEDNLGDAPVSFTAAQLEINGGTLLTTATMSIDDANRGITIGTSGGTIETAAATNLTIAGTNAMVLDGTLTKSGDGALYINSTTSGSGLVQVNDGTFGGTGTISGNTTIGADATLTAATTGTTGALTFSGDLTLVSGSTWLIDLVENNPLGVDRINVIGNLNLGGATLDFRPTDTFSGNNYVIATFGNGPTLGSTFAGLAEGDTIGNYTISYGAVTAGAITLTAVPEPGTLGLLGVALGGFFFRRLRRRRTVASLSEEGGE